MTTDVLQRVGFIYVIRRDDLRRCYVGQSILATRPGRHLLPGTYQYNELHVGGIVPWIKIAENEIPAGESLDAAERRWMRQMQHDGWTLINHLGPDVKWPHVPYEALVRGGRNRGRARAENLHARRLIDPDLDSWWRAQSAKSMKVMRARRATDAVFDEVCRTAEIAALQRGLVTRRFKRANDPAWAARERENARRAGLVGGRNGGLATARKRWLCEACGKVSTPGGIGMHQSASGHIGRKVLSTIESNEE